jgi:hypothetical protein
MTIGELFLACSTINEFTVFVVYDDFGNYLFDNAPIANGTLEELGNVLTIAKVKHFHIGEHAVYVEVEDNAE